MVFAHGENGKIMSEWICELDEGQHGKEEIIRCRDCKRCARYETWNPEGEAFNCNFWWSDTEPDGFCAWGERRSE